MLKVFVHIHNKRDYMDKKVFVEIEMPYVPRVGEFFYMGEEMLEELESKIKHNTNSEIIYKDIELECCICVVSVCYIQNKQEIHIELYERHDIQKD